MIKSGGKKKTRNARGKPEAVPDKKLLIVTLKRK